MTAKDWRWGPTLACLLTLSGCVDRGTQAEAYFGSDVWKVMEKAETLDAYRLVPPSLDRKAGPKVKGGGLIFTAKLDPGGVQTLLRVVEKGQLALAMKGASDGLRDLFFSNMSERASKIMRDDMENMGPVRLRDVDQAQMAMVQVAKDLAAKGEILLAGQGGDDELVY